VVVGASVDAGAPVVGDVVPAASVVVGASVAGVVSAAVVPGASVDGGAVEAEVVSTRCVVVEAASSSEPHAARSRRAHRPVAREVRWRGATCVLDVITLRV
jgi:hypothetical protein